MNRLKLLTLTTLGAALMFAGCKKEDENKPSGNNNNPSSTACADGNVCFKLNGSSISKPGGGYYTSDTFLFVKYEEGVKQPMR